jgi:predicted nucleic acid-binding protein
MNALVDTNILVRLSDADSPLCGVCNHALQRLLRRGDTLHLCAQTAIEFWSVATRPKAVNGLGLSAADTDSALCVAEQWMIWLPEPSDIGARWRALVNKHGVLGKQAHDARLVALMEAHGLTHLLTLNAADFARFPGLTCLHPSDVR